MKVLPTRAGTRGGLIEPVSESRSHWYGRIMTHGPIISQLYLGNQDLGTWFSSLPSVPHRSSSVHSPSLRLCFVWFLSLRINERWEPSEERWTIVRGTIWDREVNWPPIDRRGDQAYGWPHLTGSYWFRPCSSFPSSSIIHSPLSSCVPFAHLLFALSHSN